MTMLLKIYKCGIIHRYKWISISTQRPELEEGKTMQKKTFYVTTCAPELVNKMNYTKQKKLLKLYTFCLCFKKTSRARGYIVWAAINRKTKRNASSWELFEFNRSLLIYWL